MTIGNSMTIVEHKTIGNLTTTKEQPIPTTRLVRMLSLRGCWRKGLNCRILCLLPNPVPGVALSTATTTLNTILTVNALRSNMAHSPTIIMNAKINPIVLSTTLTMNVHHIVINLTLKLNVQ